MGFHVSSIANLPVGTIDFFVHVIDATRGLDSDWIAANLQRLAHDFGPKAGLVVGNGNLSQELYAFLQKNAGKDFSTLSRLLDSTSCLLISEGHLSTTTKPVYLLPIATTKRLTDDDHQATEALISLIAKAISNDELETFVASLGARKIELSEIGGGMVVCTLRHLNDALELKPNFNGVGVNLNAVIEKLLPEPKRTF
jgi:hypothetical protein